MITSYDKWSVNKRYVIKCRKIRLWTCDFDFSIFQFFFFFQKVEMTITSLRFVVQMLRYRFSQKFQMIAQKEFFELKKRDTFWWVEKANQSRILLIWMFKYKFNINDYLKKFKTRLCVKNDLQSINQNTYAITLIVKTFRALMIISIVFNLEI
jgi:hypothetical protein